LTPPVRIVVSCTDRKSAKPDPRLQLRNYSDDLEKRADAWIARITEPDGPTWPATDLYQGEHWRVVEQFESTAASSGVDVDVWVVSAGYGLIHSHTQIESYAATFATRADDSITRASSTSNPEEDARYWWSRLADRPRSDCGPASLAGLAAANPSAPVLVALSGAYVRAIQADLLDAADTLDDPEQLLLVTGDDRQAVRRHRLPADARLQHSLGGARISLNARIVRFLLETSARHNWVPAQLRSLLATALAQQPDLVRYGRQPLTDREVEAYIRRELTAQGPTPQTVLLRRLRDRNLACEQKRFAKLYRGVVEGARS
jgi:hypothetical protein